VANSRSGDEDYVEVCSLAWSRDVSLANEASVGGPNRANLLGRPRANHGQQIPFGLAIACADTQNVLKQTKYQVMDNEERR
jgi:hypothetical protein